MHDRRNLQNIIRIEEGYIHKNFSLLFSVKTVIYQNRGFAHIFIGTTKMIAVAVLLFGCEYIIFNT